MFWFARTDVLIGLCIVMGELYRCFGRAVQMLRLGLYDDWVCLYDVFGGRACVFYRFSCG